MAFGHHAVERHPSLIFSRYALPMDMSNSAIEVKVTPPVGTVLLNRPDHRNALSTAMACALRQAISDLHQEQRVRAIVITGAGDTFCAGRDLIEMATDTDEPSASPPLEKWGEQESKCCDLIVELLSIPKPVIAAVNGPVVGLGVALTLASDIRSSLHCRYLSGRFCQIRQT